MKGSNEDEELSELQLRLLALQSASRKWQQKEQQVMKASKEKITNAKPSQEKTSSSTSSASNPAERGRVTTRSASSAASEKAKALANKPQEKTKAGAKPPAEKGKAPVKGYPGRKTVSPGEQGLSAYSDPNCPQCWYQAFHHNDILVLEMLVTSCCLCILIMHFISVNIYVF